MTLAGGASAVHAADAIDAWEPVEDSTLQALQGGFRSDSGVTIAFAIDAETLLNGSPVVDKTLTVGAFAPLAGAASSIKAVLTGAAAGEANAAGLALILKNSADRQALQVRTVLQVEVTELTALRALQAQRLISSWQMATLRP